MDIKPLNDIDILDVADRCAICGMGPQLCNTTPDNCIYLRCPRENCMNNSSHGLYDTEWSAVCGWNKKQRHLKGVI